MSQTSSGYFDAAAGLPLHPVAIEAWQAAVADGWADPARVHGAGRRSALLLDAAREAVAAELDLQPDELSFQPSGPLALQAAVLGTLAGNRRRDGAGGLVHSAVEHSTVLRAATWHAERGGQVHQVEVDETGQVAAAAFLAAATTTGTAAAVLQAANHEVGTRQPVAEVAAGLAGSGVGLVVDAGHELVFGEPPSAPVFTADARLWGGPAGVGLLAIRRGTRWRAPMPVDEAESGRALGAPNVPAIVAAAASLRASRQDRQQQAGRLSGLIDQLRRRVPELVPDAVVLGAAADRLPHLVTFCCLYVDGLSLLTELDRHDFAVSSGSSCTSDTLTPSHVLVAMGALTGGNVRVSLHRGVDQADIDRFLAVLPAAVARAREGVTINAPAARHRGGPGEPAGQLIDSRGRRCPLPVLDLARALPDVPVGAELTVLADDPAAASDLAAWCRMTGQQLISTGPGPAGSDGARAYRVRRLR
ncbi:MAG: aminotransferase class V-fold PLP-dependent enzyme [Jatrophihabitantaceae bacterium]